MILPKEPYFSQNSRYVYFLYDLALRCAFFFLRIIALFHFKIRQFVSGRRNTLEYLKEAISPEDKVIWMHTASLGEFEQGLPVLQKIKEAYPNHKILLTFFSPSGYEVKKESKAATWVTYLPMDTRANARRFVKLVSPELALFVKYEIWPNYMRTLKEQKVPVLLLSAIFKQQQVFFKWYGGFMRKALGKIDHFFVQDEESARLLRTIGLEDITVSGDTRLDRVSEILRRDNTLGFMEDFKAESLCLVAGSTWPEDEDILTDFINASDHLMKYVLAPHDIKADHIVKLRQAIDKKACLYSESNKQELAEAEVLIVDTIGLLTRIYSYADIAYVGGGFATGLHNTLEPAVFGIPVVIGPKYENFKEARDMAELKGLFVVHDFGGFEEIMERFIIDPKLRLQAGERNRSYVQENQGASVQIMEYIRTLL